MELIREHWWLAYLITVLTVIAIVAFWTSTWLRRSAERRKRSVAARRRMDAVESETPLEDAERTAKSRAIERIDQQFTVTRRVIVPAVSLFALLLASIPLLAEAPGAIVSVVVAAVTVLLGIAVRPLLENAVAGLVISSSRLINIGDTVLIDDLYGTVEDISTTHTTVKIWDWRRLLLPNSQMIQKQFINCSLVDRHQWAYVEFWVSNEADLEQVERICLDAPKSSEHFAPYEEPRFWIMELGKEATKCWVAAWADTPSDAWSLKCDIRSQLLKALAKAEIPTHGFRVMELAPNRAS